LIIQGGATQVERGGLRVVAGGAVVEAVNASRDPMAFQEECLRAFEASQVARGFSELTIVNGGGTLQRFLDACGSPAWEVTPEDIDRVVGEFASQGLAASTRRGYVQAFKSFHAFLSVRKAAEIEVAFGIRLENPVDEFNAARHVSADSPSAEPPPAPERLEDFFGFLKERIAGARKYAVAGRDYALFRTLYLAGLRADEAAMMDRADVHFSRGPFGKLHVRFGKGAKTSGPRPRWVPMLDGLDLILRWYLDEIRPRMGDGLALFCDEGGGRIHRGTIRNRLSSLLEMEQAAAQARGERGETARFSPHTLRHACVICTASAPVRDVGSAA
jgi:integrase/recombinase XerD